MGKRHYIISSDNGLKTAIKDWARANKQYFPKRDFSNSQRETPTTELITKKLIELGYKVTYEPEMVVYTLP